MDCNTIIALIAVSITFVALIYSIAGMQIQIILAQLSDKARECNKYIDEYTQQVNIEDLGKLSAVVSAIITARQILNINYKWFFIFFKTKQSCIDQFYLQLHTSIRQLANSNNTFFQNYQTDDASNNIIKQQLLDSNDFLFKSIKKWQ